MTPKQADNAGTGERASAATAERPYVVLKRGLFWRPKDRGYTYNIAEAGRYTREEAEARCHPDNEPVTMELASKYESVPTLADRELAEAICRELFPEFCTGLSDDLCEFANRAAVVSKHIAAHCAAATAKERQARELAEGENARLKAKLHAINLAVDGYVDCAPDCNAVSKLANQVSLIIHPSEYP